MQTFADLFLKLSKPPGALISDESYNDLLRIYRCFPPEITRVFGFESRLGLKEATVDTALCILHENLPAFNNINFLSLVKTSTIWQSILDLLTRWRLGQLAYSKYLENIWFEFDKDKNHTGTIIPGLYIGIKEDFYKKPDWKQKYQSIISDILSCFAKSGLRGNVKKMIYKCFEFLPRSGFINYIGFMPARSIHLIRLTILIRERNQIEEYLHSIGIQEKRIRKFLGQTYQYLDYTDYGIIHLDLSEKILPRMCLELRFFSHELNYNAQHRWNPLLLHFIDNHLCTREKYNAILQWPGMEKNIPSYDIYSILRFIYYIKIICSENYTEAKAYLVYIFHPKQIEFKIG